MEPDVKYYISRLMMMRILMLSCTCLVLIACVAPSSGDEAAPECEVSTAQALSALEGDVDCRLVLLSTDYADLDPLDGLVHTNGLTIIDNAQLADMSGLEQLSLDGITVDVEHNPLLTSMVFAGGGDAQAIEVRCSDATDVSFTGVASARSVLLEGLPALEGPQFGALTTLSSLGVHETGLTTLSGFAALESLAKLQVIGNPSLPTAAIDALVAQMASPPEVEHCGNLDDDPCEASVGGATCDENLGPGE
jgi:hypothetical protein